MRSNLSCLLRGPVTRLLLALIVLSHVSVAQAAGFEVERWQVPHGPAVQFAKRPGGEAALAIVFHSGTVTDNGRGITRLLQLMMVQSNPRHPYAPLATRLWSVGGTLSLQTGLRESVAILTAPTKEFDELASELIDMMLTPELNESDLKKMRQRAGEEIGAASASTAVTQLLARITNFDARYNEAAIAVPEFLDRLKWPELQEHLKGPMSPANATVIATGDFDVARLRHKLTRAQGGAAQPVRSPRVSLPPDLAFYAPSELHLLGYRIDISHPNDSAAVRMLSPLLEARILRRFRKAGVGYSMSSEPVLTSWDNLFVIVIPAHDQSPANLKPGIYEEIKALHDGTFQDDELAEAREMVVQQLIMIDGQPGALLNELVMGLGVEGWYGPELLSTARKLTKAEFVAAVQPWINPNAGFYVQFTPNAARRHR